MLALTIVTILTMPYSVIGGVMGMNVQVPGQVGDDSLIPFYIVIVTMCLVTVILSVIFWRCKICQDK